MQDQSFDEWWVKSDMSCFIIKLSSKQYLFLVLEYWIDKLHWNVHVSSYSVIKLRLLNLLVCRMWSIVILLFRLSKQHAWRTWEMTVCEGPYYFIIKLLQKQIGRIQLLESHYEGVASMQLCNGKSLWISIRVIIYNFHCN